MEKQALIRLAKIVYNFCGMDYTTSLAIFEIKINRRLKQLNIDSIEVYIDFLNAHFQEWEALIEAITINETYFFREDKQLQIYKDKILPQLKIEKKEPIHIWSAACSTGEEPYTLAMLVAETNLFSKNELQITGSDINTHVLKMAENASYFKRSLSFRRIEPYWLNKYFDENEHSFEIKEDIKQFVKFYPINLTKREMFEKETKYDVIFCRNVLIYFDEDTTKKVIESFYLVLKKGGYLFLGHAEMIPNMKAIGFEVINDGGTFYYRKD